MDFLVTIEYRVPTLPNCHMNHHVRFEIDRTNLTKRTSRFGPMEILPAKDSPISVKHLASSSTRMRFSLTYIKSMNRLFHEYRNGNIHLSGAQKSCYPTSTNTKIGPTKL